jgi:hypothetical protein
VFGQLIEALLSEGGPSRRKKAGRKSKRPDVYQRRDPLKDRETWGDPDFRRAGGDKKKNRAVKLQNFIVHTSGRKAQAKARSMLNKVESSGSLFGSLIEEVRMEARSKELQLRGLQKQTGHIGIPEPPTKDDQRFSEPHKIPTRTKPAPKKGYDPHPSKVRYAKELSKEIAGKMAKVAASGTSYRASNSPSARAIRALRDLRDKPSKKKAKKAEAARRLPIKFPKGKR